MKVDKIERSEFFKIHIEQTEVREVDGQKLVFLTCDKCDFKRIDKHLMQTYLIGRNIWAGQHYDYINNPEIEVKAFWDNSDSFQATIGIPKNIAQMSEAELKNFSRKAWNKLANEEN